MVLALIAAFLKLLNAIRILSKRKHAAPGSRNEVLYPVLSTFMPFFFFFFFLPSHLLLTSARRQSVRIQSPIYVILAFLRAWLLPANWSVVYNFEAISTQRIVGIFQCRLSNYFTSRLIKIGTDSPIGTTGLCPEEQKSGLESSMLSSNGGVALPYGRWKGLRQRGHPGW